MKGKNNYSNYIDILKDIFVPVILFYFVYTFVLLGLPSIVMKLFEKILQVTENDLYVWIASGEEMFRAVLNGLSMLVGILPLIPGFGKEIKKHESSWPGKSYKGVLLTIILAAASSITINILFIKLHILEMSESYQQVSEHQYSVAFGIGLFLYGCISPLAEEVLFRGIIYNRLKKYFSIKVSILVSALFFGVYHANLVQGIYGFLMGMLIACVYERFSSFVYAFLFHAVANAVVYTVMNYELLYHVLITPYAGVILAVVSVGALAAVFKMKE
ncbi:MAG: CPBP family intramembrane metalloprotease [Ruminococcus flavefaciens]|nr:CPBP family intramembrane metalloprotease [Roseburia sp.]MCM1233668.1 CPBP family intramembrane metalloprotease [Ruminococcus flavefaciens]